MYLGHNIKDIYLYEEDFYATNLRDEITYNIDFITKHINNACIIQHNNNKKEKKFFFF